MVEVSEQARETIERAAKWLANCCANPDEVIEKGPPYSLEILLKLSVRDPLPEEKIPEFEKALEEVFTQEYEWRKKVVIENNYDTDPLIRRAARIIGLEPRYLLVPLKMWMTITESSIVVRRGYNGEPEQI